MIPLLLLLAGEPAYDLVLQGGRVVDGTGSPWWRADVALRGGEIARVGPGISEDSRRVIDVKGRVVAPGFIDIHTHGSAVLLRVPTADNYVRQGVTTILGGQDGSSALPLAGLLEKLGTAGLALNFGSFVGHGSVREKVLGLADRRAGPEELERMKDLVREAMEQGAFGLSTGLFYVPGTFAPTEEVVALARVAGEAGGIHISHMRNEAAAVLESVREAIAVGQEGALPSQITHHKVIGPRNWGQSSATLRLAEEARQRGVDVTIDQYPYTASMTGLADALVPAWAREGGAEALLARLDEPAVRARIRIEISERLRNERGGGDPANVRVARCAWDPSREGKDQARLTRERGFEPTVETAADTVLEMVARGETTAIFHAISERDIERILKSPWTMVASDGTVAVFGEGLTHPRAYGTFPRVLAVYVRDKKLLGLEETVRKMTSFPAQRLGLLDRGVVRPGLKADLVVFDPERVRDTATFERPHQYPEGIDLVIVNGEVVFEDGRMTGARPGRVLRGPGFLSRRGD